MNFYLVLLSLFSFSDADFYKSGQPKNPYYSRTDTTALHVPDSAWKKILPREVYQVAREKGTERAFTGKYWNATGKGTYYCAVCGNTLFRSDAKFASMCRMAKLL